MPRPTTPTTHQTVIYALVDPRDNTVRYVGRTGRYPRRVREHAITQSVCALWIAELEAQGLQVQARILDMLPKEAGASAGHQRERAWITALRRNGCPLLNSFNSRADEWLYKQGMIAA